MSNIIKCKNCGSEAVAGQAFCGECGAKIETLEDTIGPFGKKTEIKKEEKKKDINFNNFIKKYWKLGAIVIAILVIALGGFALINNISENEEGCTVIELYADENCEDNELKEISKVIKERAKIIDGGSTVKVDDGKIILTIDDEALGLDPTERKQNLNWIKTKGDVFIYSQVDYSYSDFGKEAFEEISVEQKNKSELHNYKKYFSEDEYDIIMSKDSEDINFIKVKLDDSSKVYYQQMLKNVDDNFKKYEETYQSTFDRTSLQLGIDKKEYEYAKVVGVVIPYGDKSNGEFYIVTPAAHNKNTIKLIDKVLKEENVLSTGFTEKVASTPKWETETTSFGENQVDTLDGKNIILKFTPNDYNVDSYSQNDINEYMRLVKKRLDTLGSPYMVGYTGVDYKTILIKIPPSRLIANTCSMLMQGKSIVLNNQYKQLDTGVKALTIEGTDRIIVQMDGDKNRVASEYNKTSLDLLGESLDDINASLDAIDGEVTETNEEEASPQQETGMLYLLVNDVTIAQADLSEMTEDGTVEFSKFLCFENGYCRAEESYVFDLIRQINSETEDDKNLILQGSLEVLHYDGDNEIKDEKIDWLFDSLNDYDRQIIRTIEKLGYKVEKSLTSRSRLMIDIDVDVNDDMPQKFADAVKEIYTACNFDDGSYSWIFFKIKNEYDKHPDDRCRFVAYKAEMGRLAVTFSAVVDGPTFEKYVPDFEKIVEQDEFYSSRFDN